MEKTNETIKEFLEEVYDGPNHSDSWFISNTPNSGLLVTVRGLSAEEASTPVVGGGTTAAAHVGHLWWTLRKVNSFMRGENPAWGWTLIRSLEAEFRAVVESLHPGFTWRSDAQDKEVLALIPHAAYHLGAVRQMTLMIRGGARRGQLHAL